MPAEPVAQRERRLLRRKPLKAGVTVTLRKGALGLGPNLTAGGVTLSDEGISLRVTAELAKSDEVEISLRRRQKQANEAHGRHPLVQGRRR